MVTFPLLGVLGLEHRTSWSAFCYFLSYKSGGGDLQSSANGNTHGKVNVVHREEELPAQKVAECHV